MFVKLAFNCSLRTSNNKAHKQCTFASGSDSLIVNVTFYKGVKGVYSYTNFGFLLGKTIFTSFWLKQQVLH